MRIEKNSWLTAVARIDLSRGFTAATSTEALSVGRGGGAFAPIRREGLLELGVDQLGQRSRIGLIANVPSLQPRKPRVG
jgi:hypothetical protein